MDFSAILAEAISLGATDVHLQTGRVPIFRVGSCLQESSFPIVGQDDIERSVQTMALAQGISFLSPVQDQTLAFDWHEGIRCRLHIFSEHAGCHGALRLLYPLQQLGADPDEALLQRLCGLKDGLILVTGPTGSGKTTALWRMISYLNCHRSCHIVTLEDPIEYIIDGDRALISQREEGLHFDSFQEGVKQALRQDPDVLLIGEMRDEYTMEAALTAAETGHLVFSTLHTRSAPQSVTRLVSAFSVARQEEVRCRLAQVLQGILSQRRFCGAGETYIAREILLQTTAVAQLIRSGREHQLLTVIQTGRALGMKTMEQSLVEGPPWL